MERAEEIKKKNNKVMRAQGLKIVISWRGGGAGGGGGGGRCGVASEYKGATEERSGGEHARGEERKDRSRERVKRKEVRGAS